MIVQVVQAEGVRFANEQSEHAVPDRQRADFAHGRVVEAHGDEVAELLAGADHAERAEPGLHELAGRGDDAFKHRFEAEVFGHRHDGIEQAAHSFLGEGKFAGGLIRHRCVPPPVKPM